MARWSVCGACDGEGELVCLSCLGVGEDCDKDGLACLDCLGDGVLDCEQCDGAGGWFDE